MLGSKMCCRSSISGKSLEFWFIFISLIIPPYTKVNSSANFLLDSSIRDSAFTSLHHHRTGIVYSIPMPAAFSDIEAYVIRMRTRSLWLAGVNITTRVWISPGILPEPSSVRRVVIVCESITNWSSSYFMVNGYSLISPVLGILMYNASNGNEIVETSQKLSKEEKDIIHVTFPDPKSSMENNSAAKCIMFRRGGGMEIKDAQVKKNTCVWKSIGHFAIAVPWPMVGSGGVVEKSKKQSIGGLWSVVGVGCCCGLLMGICVTGIIRLVKTRKRLMKMETRCEEDEALTSVRIQGIQIHRAGMIRTKPLLESSESRCPNT